MNVTDYIIQNITPQSSCDLAIQNIVKYNDAIATKFKIVIIGIFLLTLLFFIVTNKTQKKDLTKEQLKIFMKWSVLFSSILLFGTAFLLYFAFGVW